MRKERWLHHTTFLWDYDPSRMETLKMPKRTPHYRAMRSHNEFVGRLKEHLPSQKIVLKELKKALSSRFLLLSASTLDLKAALEKPHRQATRRLI